MVGIDEETFESFSAETIFRQHAGHGSSDYLFLSLFGRGGEKRISEGWEMGGGAGILSREVLQEKQQTTPFRSKNEFSSSPPVQLKHASKPDKEKKSKERRTSSGFFSIKVL